MNLFPCLFFLSSDCFLDGVRELVTEPKTSLRAVSINTRPPIFSIEINSVKKNGDFPLKMTIFPVNIGNLVIAIEILVLVLVVAIETLVLAHFCVESL